LINPGDEWRDIIVDHIQTARVMLVLLSANAMRSTEMKKELAVARAANVPLLGVRLEPVTLRGAFAYELTGLNWFDLFDAPEERCRQLAEFLEQLVKTPVPNAPPIDAQIASFGTGRQQKMPLVQRLLYSNPTLVLFFGIVTAVQYTLYETTTSAVDSLIQSNVSRLTAYFYVLFATSIGSPILLLTVLKQGASLKMLPLILTAAINSCLLVLMVRNGILYVYRLFIRLRQKK
jgi:hypothetical protein